MPLVTAQAYIRGLINGLIIPGSSNPGTLQAFVTPPDPNTDTAPAAYVWPSRGEETRQSVPRNIGPGTRAGWKTTDHMFDIWLVWFGEDSDPNADASFPSIVDAVMNTLRTCPDPAEVVDPNTSAVSQLVGIGERMTWDFVTPRTVEDQRWLRYSALIVVPFKEFFQA